MLSRRSVLGALIVSPAIGRAATLPGPVSELPAESGGFVVMDCVTTDVLCIDGLHLTAAGHGLLVENIVQVIGWLNVTNDTACYLMGEDGRMIT
jgi:lysophospholipase L1-like esterase